MAREQEFPNLEVTSCVHFGPICRAVARRPTDSSVGHFAANRADYGMVIHLAANVSAGLQLAIERGWLLLHEGGTYVKFRQAGAEVFA